MICELDIVSFSSLMISKFTSNQPPNQRWRATVLHSSFNLDFLQYLSQRWRVATVVCLILISKKYIQSALKGYQYQSVKHWFLKIPPVNIKGLIVCLLLTSTFTFYRHCCTTDYRDRGLLCYYYNCTHISALY